MKNYIIIGIVVASIIFFIMQRKKKADKDKKDTSVRDLVNTSMDINKPGDMKLDQQIVEALKFVADKYGIDIARKVEQIYRLETAHFKSGQFKNTFSPGMEKHKNEYPFGWTSMKPFWDKINFVPTFHEMSENKTGIRKVFVKFPNVLIAMESLAQYIKKYSPERWYSLDPVKQSEYRDSLNSIKPKIVNKFA